MKRKKSNGDTYNQKIKTKRRAFLKKAVYKAPALIVLGSLVKPAAAVGASECGYGIFPPCDPGGA